ncbi:hypothetical protein PAXINDRAFT_33614, partial [Paxillus involutus ATCC 200175]
KRRKKELEPSMDFLINAEKRPGVMCRRKVFDICFDNASADALHDWREEKTADVYGWACLNDHGPSLVIPNSILDHIIDCAHHGKIHTSQDLQKETGWTDSEKYGSEILSLLTAHAPPRQSLLVVTPLQHNTANNPMLPHVPTASGMQREHVELPVSAVASKRRNKCSACGQEGHNARNCICPNHPSRT